MLNQFEARILAFLIVHKGMTVSEIADSFRDVHSQFKRDFQCFLALKSLILKGYVTINSQQKRQRKYPIYLANLEELADKGC